jgi:hypothetical protein
VSGAGAPPGGAGTENGGALPRPAWPPLVGAGDAVPAPVRARDVALTLAAWATFFWLLVGPALLLADDLVELAFGVPSQPGELTLDAILRRVAPYAAVAAVLVLALAVRAIQGLIVLLQPAPPAPGPVTEAEEETRLALAPGALAAWRAAAIARPAEDDVARLRARVGRIG